MPYFFKPEFSEKGQGLGIETAQSRNCPRCRFQNLGMPLLRISDG
jgi:hypothetical protein